MGANRQNVQRIVNELAKDGIVAFEPNPHHRRGQLVILTDTGRKAFDAAMRMQAPRINGLASGFSIGRSKQPEGWSPWCGGIWKVVKGRFGRHEQ